MAAVGSTQFFSPESMSASGKDAAKLSLPLLQSKMKCDPEGYESELSLLYRHFDSSLHLFQHQSALNPSSDPVIAKELGDLAMFLAHVTPFYPTKLADFPGKLADLLRKDGRMLPASLRTHLAQALILLVNRKMVGMEETLELFMELQVLGDRTLRKFCFSHVVHSIRRMNQKHKDESKNRKLQSILFSILQEEDEGRAKRALVILCDLHRRKVWFDDRTANAICTACFHTSSKIMISTLSFLLGYEQVEEEEDTECSSSEDDTTTHKSQVILSKESIYKAHHKGTQASKKKKKAKLQRVMRSMKKQQRISSENSGSSSYSPLIHLKDAQGFAEKLFSRLQKCNERFEVKMMVLKVIARTVGLHRLILLNLYPFLQKYVQPHQRDVTTLLAAAVQACHDMVPPDAVEPLFKQIVNQFVHDRSRTEAIAVGLNVVREICLRIPLLMNEDLLQDLVLYKKSHEKAVSTAARSLITLFREICPSFLVKKDRGRPIDPKARPKAFGETHVANNVPGAELLEIHDESISDSSDNEDNASDDENISLDAGTNNANGEVSSESEKGSLSAESDEEDASVDEEEDEVEADLDDACDVVGEFDSDDDDDSNDDDGEEEGGDDDEVTGNENDADGDNSVDDNPDRRDVEEAEVIDKCRAPKRKLNDFDASIVAANASLRALKRFAGSKNPHASVDMEDGILSNEDFHRIKELQAKKELKTALSQQGLSRKGSDMKTAPFKIPSSEQLSVKRVDPAKLEVNIRRKLSKEERLALVKAGREERGKYQARAAVKKKKQAGSSNRQKEHKKLMPYAAKKAKVARSRQEKKKQQRRSGKQFRGKKAWK